MNMKDFFNWVQAQKGNSMVKMNIDHQNRNQTPIVEPPKPTDDEVSETDDIRTDIRPE